MQLDAYQTLARETAVYPKESALEYLSLGLAAEAGEVADKVAKLYRGDKKPAGLKPMEYLNETVEGHIAREQLVDELGDVLWFVAQLSDLLGSDLNRVALKNLKKLNDRQKQGTLKGSGDNR